MDLNLMLFQPAPFKPEALEGNIVKKQYVLIDCEKCNEFSDEIFPLVSGNGYGRNFDSIRPAFMVESKQGWHRAHFGLSFAFLTPWDFWINFLIYRSLGGRKGPRTSHNVHAEQRYITSQAHTPLVPEAIAHFKGHLQEGELHRMSQQWGYLPAGGSGWFRKNPRSGNHKEFYARFVEEYDK